MVFKSLGRCILLPIEVFKSDFFLFGNTNVAICCNSKTWLASEGLLFLFDSG